MIPICSNACFTALPSSWALLGCRTSISFGSRMKKGGQSHLRVYSERMVDHMKRVLREKAKSLFRYVLPLWREIQQLKDKPLPAIEATVSPEMQQSRKKSLSASLAECSSYQHVSVIKRDWIIGTSQGSMRGWNYERPHQGIRYLYPADVYFHDRCG